MPEFATEHRVGHSAGNMFDLVADVARYPEFVPYCTAMDVVSRSEEDGTPVVTARMTVAYGIIKETFTNRIVLDRANLTISVRASDGPFRRLENDWRFEPVDSNSCTIHFSIAYEFRSLALRLAAGAVSERAFGNYSKIFEDRADAIYGNAGS